MKDAPSKGAAKHIQQIKRDPLILVRYPYQRVGGGGVHWTGGRSLANMYTSAPFKQGAPGGGGSVAQSPPTIGQPEDVWELPFP